MSASVVRSTMRRPGARSVTWHACHSAEKIARRSWYAEPTTVMGVDADRGCAKLSRKMANRSSGTSSGERNEDVLEGRLRNRCDGLASARSAGARYLTGFQLS